MFITPLFPNFFASEELNIDNDKLVQHVHELEKSGVSADNHKFTSSWQSGYIDLQHHMLTEIMNCIRERIQALHQNVFNLDDKVELEVMNGWFNRSSPATLESIASNEPHIHPGSFISFVYYVKADPHAGNLVMIPNDTSLQLSLPNKYIKENNIFNCTQYTVMPTTGLLVAFPSWIRHYVESNKSKADRISFAVNVKLPTA